MSQQTRPKYGKTFPRKLNFSLCVCVCSANGDIRHYQIKITDTGQFFLAEKHTFSSIPDVIHYHEHNAAGTVAHNERATSATCNASFDIECYVCVGLVTRLRYAVGPMGNCVPATSGFSSGESINTNIST